MALFTNYYGGFFVLTFIQNETVQLKTSIECKTFGSYFLVIVNIYTSFFCLFSREINVLSGTKVKQKLEIYIGPGT